MSRPRVYLAGPDVFFANPKEHGAYLKKRCADAGLVGVFPLDAEIVPSSAKRETARRIFDANVGLIRSCQAVLANMTPFRGPSADVGTAWEMGYAAALSLKVVAYTEDPRMYAARVEQDGYEVESFDLRDNLMLACGAEVYFGLEAALVVLGSCGLGVLV